MKRSAISIILAGGLFTGLLGATGAAPGASAATSSTDFGGTIALDAADDALPLGMGDTHVRAGAGTSAPFVIGGGGVSLG